MTDRPKAEMFACSLTLLLCTSSVLRPLASGYTGSRQRVLEDDSLKYGGIVIDWNCRVTGSERYQCVRLRTQGAHNLNCTVDKNSHVEYMHPRRTYPD
jgi:hypothetical protein